ncbi:MAG: hypothetical protein IT384_27775 [Deltaproteobacteria bacterium]|nr:hypothetical protein [Deltaproteobacteria bacterium]
MRLRRELGARLALGAEPGHHGSVPAGAQWLGARRLGAQVLLGLLGVGCARSDPVLLLPDEYDLIVAWAGPDGPESRSVLHVRSPGASMELDAGPGLRLFAYRASDLLEAGEDVARLDGTAVRALQGCGPQLPPAERAFAISRDGELVEISDQPMPSLEALAVPCRDPGGLVYATPVAFSAGCATSSASSRGGCTLCFDVSACEIAGRGSGDCAAPGLPIRTALDGSVCSAPPPGATPCVAGAPHPGSETVLRCTRSQDSDLTIDVVRTQGLPSVAVTRYDLSAAPDFTPLRSDDDSPGRIFNGPLTDLLVRGDRLVVVERGAAETTGQACSATSFATVLLVSLDGSIVSSQVSARPCLQLLAPDPLDATGFIGGHHLFAERRLSLVRYDRRGVEQALIAELSLPPIAPDPTFGEAFHALAITGTTGDERVTAFVDTTDPIDRTTWATWSFASGVWAQRAGGRVERTRYLFVAPSPSGSAARSIVLSDDYRDEVVIFDPLSGPLRGLARQSFHPEMSQGPVIALSTGDRWLAGNGGLSAGTVTLFDRQGERAFVPYFADNQAGITGLIEIAPNLVWVTALRRQAAGSPSELAILHVGGDRLWFEPQLLPLGPGIVGRLTRGELCPDGTTRVVWALAPWTGEVLRIVAPCD